MVYKKLLLQHQRFDGIHYTDVGGVIDCYTQYGVVCQEFPFKHLPESKELPKRDWFDEDGEDSYIPKDGLKAKAYDLEVKFLYVNNSDEERKRSGSTMTESELVAKMKTDLVSFINNLYGKDNDGASLMKIYDEYTCTGRRGVYVLSVDNDLFFNSDSSSDVIAQFKVKFRVTDPITEVQNNNGTLIEDE